MLTTLAVWLAVATGAVLGAGAAMTAVGALISPRHVVGRTLMLPVPAATVWATIVDFPGQTTWRRAITAVERLPDRAGNAVWRERFGRHELTLQTVELHPEAYLIRQIEEGRGAFRGSWEWSLEPLITPSNARLTLTERGEVGNPFFRFVNRFIVGRSRSVDEYLVDLAHRFQVEPRFIPSVEAQREVDAPTDAGPH